MRWPIAVLVLAVGLLPLIVTPVLPLIDFYNHVARFQVLATLASNPLFAANYAAAWAILPNIGLDVIAVAALQVVPLALLPHLVAALILAVLFAGLLALNRAITGQTRWPVLLLALPLLYSWIFNWGFASFLLGLGLALLSAAWWLTQRQRPVRRLLVALLLAVVTFMSHALAFGLYGILIGSLAFGHWLQQSQRRFADLAKEMVLCAAQAVLPAMLFLQTPTVQASGGFTNADEAIARLLPTGLLLDRLMELGRMRLETIVRVAEGLDYASDALWLVALLIVIAAAFRQGALRLAPLVWPAVLAGVLLVCLMPPALFGTGYVADRMPLFLALVLVAGLTPGPRPMAWLVPTLAGLAALRLLLVAWQWHGTAADLADFDAVASRLPPNQVVAGLAVGAGIHEDAANRCEMYPPLLLLRYSHATPLFVFRAAQPLELRGTLAAARDAMKSLSPAVNARRHPETLLSAFAQAGYPYVLLCQVSADRPLPQTPYPLVAQAGRFRLLRLAPAR